MIYPSKFPKSIDNPAEENVFNALARLPENDFDIFYSKCFSGASGNESSDYEIDFLLIDKRNDRFNGILIIEVKGGNLSYSAKENCWFQNKRKMDHGPDDQAKKNKYNLLKRYKNILRNVPTEWALWFPDGLRSAGSFTPTHLAPWQVMDYQSIDEVKEVISDIFSNMQERYAYIEGEPIDTYKKKLEKSLLRGMGIVQPMNILLKKYEEKYIYLEKMQKMFFEQMYQQKRIAVSGGAGTGKTIMATAAAIDFANEGKNVLLLCYNRMLSEVLKKTCDHENIKAVTFHTFAYDFITSIEPDWFEDKDTKDHFFNIETLPKKFGKLIKSHLDKFQYDALIIDEAQDLSEHWMETVLKLTCKDANIVILYDENQDIFERQFQIPEHDSFIKLQLRYNFRNTLAISEYVTNKTNIPISSKETPEGLPVDTINYSNNEELTRQLEITIQRLVTIEKISCSDITILVDGHLNEHPLNQIEKIAFYSLLPWHNDVERDSKTLHFTSINRFKGLESPVVLLILNGSMENVNAKMFYTQGTRAKSMLKVFCKN